MEIKCLVLGDLQTNCYIVVKNNKCLIIDPASDGEAIIKACCGYRVEGILVTHHHFDHVGALKIIEDYYNLKHNSFDDNWGYEVIETPGHASDGLTFYFSLEKVMFTGDFIFKGTIGRYDFVGSNLNDMKESLKKINKYPSDVIIYPGHGDKTVLGLEKMNFNYYF